MAKVPRILASERCVDPWKTEAHFWIDRRLARITEAITTNSVGVRDFYAKHGIDPNLFRLISNGIEPREASPIDRAEAFRRLEVAPDRKLILAVGRLWPQKRYRDLIWAAELLATLREDITLVIIGDGPQRGELMRFRDAVTRPDRVRFAGNRTDVAELLPHADLFWIGSEFEGQSNSVIEAMQAGLAVVATNIPGNRELVGQGETGRLIDVGDTADLARQSNILLEDDEERARLGAAAKGRIADEFTVAQMIQKHVDLYQGN
jgi:glycosyltransferase involved in cell wall biosynthesis